MARLKPARLANPLKTPKTKAKSEFTKPLNDAFLKSRARSPKAKGLVTATLLPEGSQRMRVCKGRSSEAQEAEVINTLQRQRRAEIHADAKEKDQYLDATTIKNDRAKEREKAATRAEGEFDAVTEDDLDGDGFSQEQMPRLKTEWPVPEFVMAANGALAGSELSVSFQVSSR